MKIYVKKVEGISIPEQGSPVSAGYDIVATSDPKIVGETFKDSTGTNSMQGYRRIDYIEYETNLFIAPSSPSFHTLIHPRSSVSKYNLVLANSIGLVDNDYRGMVICRFKYIWQPEDFIMESINIKKEGELDDRWEFTGKLLGKPNMEKIYKKGDKIAQLVGETTISLEWELADDLVKTRRGEGGFGSTDKKVMIANPVNFEEGPSNMAERYRKLNYVEKPAKTYEQFIKESQQ